MREALSNRRAGVGAGQARLRGQSRVVEARNPKAEGRKKPEIRSPNLATHATGRKMKHEWAFKSFGMRLRKG